jgi:hypothetical protein
LQRLSHKLGRRGKAHELASERGETDLQRLLPAVRPALKSRPRSVSFAAQTQLYLPSGQFQFTLFFGLLSLFSEFTGEIYGARARWCVVQE